MNALCAVLGHKWNSGICERCEALQEGQTIWQAVAGELCLYKNQETGLTLHLHDWDGGYCRRCGHSKDQGGVPDSYATSVTAHLTRKAAHPDPTPTPEP